MPTKSVPHRVPERTYRSHFTDSTHWGEYEPRPGDVVISTPLKVGTTWAQRITAALVFGTAELPGPLMSISPWLDCTYYPLVMQLMGLEQQEHRRFLKTHLPVDALPIYSEVSYLVVGRDLRDAALSTFNHARGVGNSKVNPLEVPTGDDVHTPELPKIPEDPRKFWKRYFTRSAFPWESDGWPYNSPTHHLASWWGLREEPNVLLLHYQDMLDDLDAEMRRVAAFLDIKVDETVWPELVTSCTFGEMKARSGSMWSGQLGSSLSSFDFFHKGKSGQWQEALTEADLAHYETAMTRVPADLRAWLEHTA